MGVATGWPAPFSGCAAYPRSPSCYPLLHRLPLCPRPLPRRHTQSRMVRGLATPLLYVAGLTTAIAAYHTAAEAGLVPASASFALRLPDEPFALTSFALSLLLVFRCGAGRAARQGTAGQGTAARCAARCAAPGLCASDPKPPQLLRAVLPAPPPTVPTLPTPAGSTPARPGAPLPAALACSPAAASSPLPPQASAAAAAAPAAAAQAICIPTRPPTGACASTGGATSCGEPPCLPLPTAAAALCLLLPLAAPAAALHGLAAPPCCTPVNRLQPGLRPCSPLGRQAGHHVPTSRRRPAAGPDLSLDGRVWVRGE